MKHTAEIETYESGNSSLDGVDRTDLEVTIDENTAVFVCRTTVMSRGRGHDVIDPYRICKDFLNQQAQQRMEGSKNDSERRFMSVGGGIVKRMSGAGELDI